MDDGGTRFSFMSDGRVKRKGDSVRRTGLHCVSFDFSGRQLQPTNSTNRLDTVFASYRLLSFFFSLVKYSLEVDPFDGFYSSSETIATV